MRNPSFDFCNEECRDCYREDMIAGIEYPPAFIDGVILTHREATSALRLCAFCGKGLRR